MSETREIFDSDLLRKRRRRAAPSAPAHDFLLRHAVDDLMDRLAAVRRTFPVVLCLGAHNGLLGRRIGQRKGLEALVEMDDCEPLLAECVGRRVHAHPEALPIREASLDLVLSALNLQLVNDLPGALIQIRRALKPDGLFLASLLGRESLSELREAWLAAEAEVTGGASPRVAPFADVRAIGGVLQRAGFALPVVDSDRLTVTYPSPLALMAELKGMGWSNMLNARSRRPVVRHLLARAAEVYAERFGGADGRVRATFEIVSVSAWAPHESQQKPLKPGSARRRLAEALGVAEGSPPPFGKPTPSKG
jgi:SAM-dependent methyltransferase